jgi:hypothetical protein
MAFCYYKRPLIINDGILLLSMPNPLIINDGILLLSMPNPLIINDGILLLFFLLYILCPGYDVLSICGGSEVNTSRT